MSTATADTVSGARKAAILLLSLGDQTSAEILRQLSEDEVHKISLEIARLDAVGPDQAEIVLEEFHQKTCGQDAFVRGGPLPARKLLAHALGAESAQKVLDTIAQQVAGEGAKLGALEKADPAQLAGFIQNEHPQTIALILSNLNPRQAGALLISLPAELRPEIALRMAHMDQISPEVLGRIAEVMDRKLKNLGRAGRKATGGSRLVADILNRVDSGAAEEILTTLEQDDSGLAQNIRNLMFVFEDVLALEKEAMKALLGKIDRKVLAIALKGTSDQLKNHFMQCMSQRGGEMLREDMDALGPIRIREVESAQQQILATVRQLQNEGAIGRNSSEGDQYVV
jgi:flagellar motor switch protein FliG